MLPNMLLYKPRLRLRLKKLRFLKRKLLTIKRKLTTLKCLPNLKNQLNLKLQFLLQDLKRLYQLQIVIKRKLLQKPQLPKKKHQKLKLQLKNLKMKRLTKLKPLQLPQSKLLPRVFLSLNLLTNVGTVSLPNTEKV